ncbi:TonB-dependent receptor [Aestuariibaculum suncheonense]
MYLFIILFNIGAFAFSQKITLNLNGVPLHEALRTISDKANIDFFYSDDTLDINRIVNIEFVDTDVEVIVSNLIGSGFKLEEQSNGLYLIVPVEVQQGRLLSGVVTDEIGQPLPGVTVLVKETKKGVSTDFDGNFKIVVEKGQTIVFSYVGFKTQEVVFENQKSINVKLVEDISALEEVIVTGIVERKKETYTGAVSTFSGEELKAIGNQNIIQSIRTLDPSFIVLENNLQGSNPNVLPNIEVRGQTSITNDDLRDEFGADPNSPLFILDGFETDLRSIVDLDMNRVASITILKDAASTALYGSKAANGVVVVETKRPESGKIILSYTGDFSVDAPDLTDYNLMNASEKLEYERLAGMWTYYIEDYSVQVRLDSLYNQKLADVRRGVDTYWLSEPTRTAITQRHSVYAAGGSDEFRFNAGLNYRDGQGVMKGSGRDTWGANIDLNYRKGKVNISNRFYMDGYTAMESNYGSFSNFARANPYYRKYDENGEITRYLDENGVRTDFVNPLYRTTINSSDETKGIGFRNNLNIIVDLTSRLRLNGGVQLRNETSEREVFIDPEDPVFDDVSFFEKGEYRNTEIDNFSYMANLMLTYRNLFAEKHSVTANLRADVEEQNNESYGTVAVGFPNGTNANPSFSFSYDPNAKPSYSTRKYRRNNIMGLVNYAYDNRYLLDFTYRLDGSTAFGANEKYSPFWSVGLGWNIHKERGVNSSVINLLRLKQTFGYTGNQNLGSVASTSVYAYGSTINEFGAGVGLVTLANPNLEWQRTFDMNLGLDIALFNNRLDGRFNLYRKNTDPLVVPVSLAASTGLTSYPLNVGRLEVKGFEAIVNYKIINDMKNRFMWRLGVTTAIVNMQYDGFGNQLQELDEEAIQSGSLKRYKDGFSPDDIWAVPSLGIDPATGKEVFLQNNGQTSFVHNYDDETVVGNSRPDLEGVISNNFSFKDFTLGINLRYRLGGQQFNNALFNKVENISYSEVGFNQDKRALYDRWQQPGDMAMFKGITETAAVPISSRFVQDENLIIGESVNLGYRASNKKWLDVLGVSTLRFNAYMNNILRASTVLAERGLDYPFARSVSFSINASF